MQIMGSVILAQPSPTRSDSTKMEYSGIVDRCLLPFLVARCDRRYAPRQEELPVPPPNWLTFLGTAARSADRAPSGAEVERPLREFGVRPGDREAI